MKDASSDDMATVPITPAALAALAVLGEQGVVSSTVAKDVFEKMWTSGRSAQAIIDAEGLAQIDDQAAMAAIVAGVIAANPGPVEQYRGGKTATFGFLVGQVMKASKGKANPVIATELLKRALVSSRAR